MLIFYGFYRLFNRISEKIQDHITDANLNRIIHEKKKSIINQNEVSEGSYVEEAKKSVSDELLKLKELLDAKILTEDEFISQKKKILGDD